MRHWVCSAILAVGLAFGQSAFATQDQWPALYNVTGVAKDDALNVRQRPSVQSDVIGTIAFDATDIEVVSPNAAETWGQVNMGETSGWVSLTFLQRQSDQWLGAPLKIRQCFGTEPFWSLRQDEPQIVLNAPEIEPRQGMLSSFYRSESRRDRFFETGSLFPGPWGDRDLTLAYRLEACSDGMSDRTYGISVDMLIRRPTLDGDRSMTGAFSGCCTISPQP